MTRKNDDASVLSTLQDLLILNLGQAGLTQRQIREIVRVDMHRVSRVLKFIKEDHGKR